jgi:hypothetical protein
MINKDARQRKRTARAGRLRAEHGHKTVDDIDERGEADAAPRPHRFDAEGDCQVAPSVAGLTNEVDDLVAVDEVECGQRHDPAAFERWLEREVKPRQHLDPRRAICGAVLMRRMVISSASSASIASIAVAWPRSSCWTT